MQETHHSSLGRRRYRLAQAVVVAGALAVGSLIVDKLVAIFRDDFFLFYGISSTESVQIEQIANARLPLTLGQLVVACITLVMVVVFVATERRRLRHQRILKGVNMRRSRAVVSARLRGTSLFDAFVLRTSGFAGLLLSVWLLQSSLERWLGGFGLGIEYASWRSLLPLASVFGVCVLAGMVVAAFSLVGMRAIYVLELAFKHVRRRREVAVVRVHSGHESIRSVRTFRELMGCEILSRPPPAAC